MLYAVATPIGNLDDMTPRAVAALRQADVIACEDTRRTRALMSHFGIPAPSALISYRQQTERRAGEQLLALLQAGKSVALCSDGGYPGISDPGYRLVRLAHEHGIAVCVIPGASAVHTSLVASGMSTSSYTFKGYPPRKEGAMRRFFEQEKDLPHTLVVFESPRRVAKTLRVALDVLGNREAALCVELTKKFERVSRGFLKDLLASASESEIKGEVTVVIAGNNPKFAKDPTSIR